MDQLVEERQLRIDTAFPGGESWRQAVEQHRWLFSDVVHRHDGARVLMIATSRPGGLSITSLVANR
ncbi:MAG: hypothetical protein ABR583_05735 [Gaiellaceae bacterium]